MWTLYYHTDFPERLNYHSFLKEELSKKVTLVNNPEEAEIVFNMGSIHNKGLIKGKRLTLYLESDDYLYLGRNKEYYKDSDIVYISSKKYLKYYPPHTKLTFPAINPNFHRELPVEKRYDFVYIGTLEPLPVYINRLRWLNAFIRVTESIYIGYGRPETYPLLMSMGKVILNFLPLDPNTNSAGLNMKITESMAMGCMLTDYKDVLDDVAVRGVHYLTIDDFNQKKINEARINEVKKASRELVIKNYTFRHQVDKILNDIDEKL